MDILRAQPLAYPEKELLRWKEGNYEMLARLHASPFLKRILCEKLRNRKRPGRRFFGEAFVAAHVDHQAGWYGSFKWLTYWPVKESSPYAAEYRAALKDAFPSAPDISRKSLLLARLLNGKKPVPPDLWLIVNGEHRFIEVKLPGDSIHPTQIAGLAIIATCLARDANLSVWIYNLYPEGGRADPISASVRMLYNQICDICTQPNSSS